MYLEDKVDKLIDLMQSIERKLNLFMPDLTTERGVINFIGVTRETFNGYLDRKLLIEGVHYVYSGRQRVFFEDEIIKLKKQGIKGKRTQSTKQEQVNSIKEKLSIAA